jgi:predicted nucleic acid-binding Zn ribbon protein
LNDQDEDEDESELPDPGDRDDEDDDVADTEPCPFCGKSVFEQSEQCPHCGNFISGQESSKRSSPWIVVAAIICLIVIIFVWLK